MAKWRRPPVGVSVPRKVPSVGSRVQLSGARSRVWDTGGTDGQVVSPLARLCPEAIGAVDDAQNSRVLVTITSCLAQSSLCKLLMAKQSCPVAMEFVAQANSYVWCHHADLGEPERVSIGTFTWSYIVVVVVRRSLPCADGSFPSASL